MKIITYPELDTELVRCSVSSVACGAHGSQLDMCTGSGAIGISMARCVQLSDISEGTRVARKNAEMALLDSICPRQYVICVA